MRKAATETSEQRKHDNTKHCQKKCKRVWTRLLGEDKTIIEYVLTNTASANTVKEMNIDEEKQYTINNKKIYSDLNSILVNLMKHQLKN